MIYVLCGTEQNGMRFHNVTQKGMQLKTFESFISRTFGDHTEHVVCLHSLSSCDSFLFLEEMKLVSCV